MLRKLRPLSKSTDLYILLHVNLIKKLYTNIELYLVWLLFAIVWAQVSELFFFNSEGDSHVDLLENYDCILTASTYSRPPVFNLALH